MPTLMPTPVPQGTYTSADIVLLTDGENNESPDPLAAALTAAASRRADLHGRNRERGGDRPAYQRLYGTHATG